MSGWKAKRFWQAATAEVCDGGFTIHLDGRPVKTPAKSPLIVPTRGMALAIAAEWDAQQGEVRPDWMPVTRSANSAIDKITPQKAEVAALIAAYGDSDLICYRAISPVELRARQAAAWDPMVDWAADALQAPLAVGSGVMPVPQDKRSVDQLAARINDLDSFRMAALHDLVAISGSLVLGFAVTLEKLTAQQAWNLSRIDEDWQIEKWGPDDEALALTAAKYQAFLQAAQFYQLSTD